MPAPGRMRMRADEAALYSVVPSAAVTMTFQVVAVPEVVGVKRSRASAGKVAAMPSIVQVPPRP